MAASDLPLIMLLFSLAVAVIGLAFRSVRLLSHPSPADPSPPRAPASRGIIYAFTLGMLPWKKDSARLHKLAYVRGVLFHLGIFASVILVLLNLLLDIGASSLRLFLMPFLVLGSLAGLMALVTRFADRSLRALSRADDYIALALVVLMLVSASAFALNVVTRAVFWGAASVVCLYLPWSKIPHAIYFFFSRNNFGALFGRRGVLPPPRAASAGRLVR